MRCPNRRCRRQTERKLCWSDKRGKPHWGCPACIHTFRPENRDVNVRTGRKIWHAYEVYGAKKTMEKNQEWIGKVSERAAKNRREVGCISEGAYKVLEQHTREGRMRPRVDGRPVR